jgi:hypothetical protein
VGSYKRDPVEAQVGARTMEALFRRWLLRPPPTPPYRVVRTTEITGRTLIPTRARAFVYDIPHGQNMLQYRVAMMLDLAGDSMTRLRVEAVLRDFLRFATVREQVVIVTTADWRGEFWIAEVRGDQEAEVLWLAV